MSRLARGAFLTVLLLCSARDARADWLLTPFVGFTFAGHTPLVTLELGGVNAKHWVFGGSAGWLSDHIIGVEVDFLAVPGIFTKENPDNLITSNSAIAFTGNVVAAAPLSVTGAALRPYLAGGVGILRAELEDRICLLGCISITEPAVQVGGGAIGLVTERAGLRFDLRYLRTLAREDSLTGDRRAKLSFWRATIGVVLRY